MTEEARQKLCQKLISTWSTVQEQIKAANEIERLAAEVQRLRGENDWLRVALRAAQMGVANAAAN